MNMQHTIEEIKAFKRHSPNATLIIASVLLGVVLILFGALVQGCEGTQLQISPMPPTAAVATDQDGVDSVKAVQPPAQPSDIEVVGVEAKGNVNIKVTLKVFNETLTLTLKGEGEGDGNQKLGCFDVSFAWGFAKLTQSYPKGCK